MVEERDRLKKEKLVIDIGKVNVYSFVFRTFVVSL